MKYNALSESSNATPLVEKRKEISKVHKFKLVSYSLLIIPLAN